MYNYIDERGIMTKKIILILILLIIPFSFLNGKEKEINLHLFYGKECPHCEKEIEYLNNYIKENSFINLYKYEIWHNKANQKRYVEVKELLNTSKSGVPFLVIGNQVIVGFGENYTEEAIESIIKYYLNNNYRDIVGEALGVSKINNDIELVNGDILAEEINVPLLGKINPKTVSLPILAIVIGSIDGFNPCAMWILIFLITMLFGMKDRKKMWILGLTFLVTSALIYLFFMMAWLNVAMFMNKIIYIRILIGIVAIVFGAINIKEFFTNKDGECKVVNSSNRKKLMSFIKKITHEQKFILSIIGIIILACLINLIELLCSLGLPVVFTQVLALNNLSGFEQLIYSLIYILFFLIDDIIVFALSMKALKVTAVTSKYTKYSHLIGGTIMILIGLLMIFKIEWLMFNF